jgi:hypothetical protein
LLFVGLLTVLPAQPHAQDRVETTLGEPIPRNYQSWSLFLVCNPQWIIGKGDPGIRERFKAYRAFGSAIGPQNLAIWFWKKPVQNPTVEDTDIDRMSSYCTRFGLTPSETPQVVATTHYPDDSKLGDRVVANLNGNPEKGARLLSALADQLLKTGLNQSGLDSSERWISVVSAASTALNSVGCYFDKVKISVDTKLLNVEIEHSGTEGCGTP